MALLNKGRLSVQPVEKEAWVTISKIANKGYGDIDFTAPKRPAGNAKGKATHTGRSRSHKNEPRDASESEVEDDGATGATKKRKRNRKQVVKETDGTRKTKKTKK